MKLPITLAIAAVLTAGSLFPTSAQAAPKSHHREANFREARHHHHHRHSKLVRVWVRGHVYFAHGHRHWVPGHYEWRRIYFWA